MRQSGEFFRLLESLCYASLLDTSKQTLPQNRNRILSMILRLDRWADTARLSNSERSEVIRCSTVLRSLLSTGRFPTPGPDRTDTLDKLFKNGSINRTLYAKAISLRRTIQTLYRKTWFRSAPPDRTTFGGTPDPDFFNGIDQDTWTAYTRWSAQCTRTEIEAVQSILLDDQTPPGPINEFISAVRKWGYS
jgi:hypothetical protein